MFSGSDCLPAGGEEGPGELEKRPCEKDQNAGVRAEAGEVNARHFSPPTMHTNNNCTVIYNTNNEFLDMELWCVRMHLHRASTLQ